MPLLHTLCLPSHPTAVYRCVHLMCIALLLLGQAACLPHANKKSIFIVQPHTWEATLASGSSMATPPDRSSRSAAFSASATTTPLPRDFHLTRTMFLSRITAVALASVGAAWVVAMAASTDVYPGSSSHALSSCSAGFLTSWRGFWVEASIA